MPVAAIDGDRVPIGFGVASITAFAHLADISVKRYGKRENQSRSVREALFERLTKILPPDVHFKSMGINIITS